MISSIIKKHKIQITGEEGYHTNKLHTSIITQGKYQDFLTLDNNPTTSRSMKSYENFICWNIC